jgi:ribosomal protein S18 acetylase RimI-like enzyme
MTKTGIDFTAAGQRDVDQLLQLDHHVTPEVLARKVAAGEVHVAREGQKIVGWLRYSYFWDQIPFMNMLGVLEPYRRQGIGTQLITSWEETLRARGHREVLTSTLADEQAQFLYRKLGYVDCGALLLPGEALEILLRKEL